LFAETNDTSGQGHWKTAPGPYSAAPALSAAQLMIADNILFLEAQAEQLEQWANKAVRADGLCSTSNRISRRPMNAGRWHRA
jgi:hypothetical protein